MPKVSVLMPAYNAEKYIAEAIDSILQQTFSDFEFIIIDDASSDETVTIIKNYTDSRIRFYQNECNMGVASTLNRGLDLATGTYIARMDSDDISLPQRLEKQVAFMDSHPDVAVVATGVRLFGAQVGERQFSATHELLKIDTLFGNCFAHPSVMMRAALFGSSRMQYDNAYNKMEDYDLWVRVAEQHKLASISDILLQYRIHPGQVTQKPTAENKHQLRQLRQRQLAALGIDTIDESAELYLTYCLGELTVSPESIVGLSQFFDSLRRHNTVAKIYEPKLLDSYLTGIIRSLLSNIPGRKAAQICSQCGISSLFYSLERGGRGFIAKCRQAVQRSKLQSKLKHKDFTIISNNCWGSFIYQKYGLPYRSPTAGLFILGHDFIKLCADWQHYMNLKLEFIPWESATYYESIKNSAPYPVAKLGNIEIYFMHYHSQEEAAVKWYRRVARINPDRLLFKLSQREGCSREDVERFMALPYAHKICFAYDKVPGTIYVPELKTLVGDEFPIVQKYLDEIDVLNSL